MSRRWRWWIGLTLAGFLAGAAVVSASDPPPTSAEVLAASQPADWRALDPENTLYLDLPAGRVVVELAPWFAPGHVANVKTLARERFYDGLTIYRVQENYVVQGGDIDGERVGPDGRPGLRAEAVRRTPEISGFVALPDPDSYAAEAGFVDGFPVARDAEAGTAWLVHCPGAFAMPRDVDPDSGTTDFYVVIGHAPRHLDRNVTVFGRVVRGMEWLSTLPRGEGPMGFFEAAEDRQPIERMIVAADLPLEERVGLEILRTDTDTFRAWVEARRNRTESWFVAPAGYVGVCNVPIPVRESTAPQTGG